MSPSITMIPLFAKANKLGIPNFRQMSEADLKAAIAKAKKGAKTAPAKGKTNTVAKGKTATATKGKTATPAKGKTNTPAKGKTTAAKPAKSVKATPAKSTARKTTPAKKATPAKGKAAQGAKAKRSPARGKKQPVGAVLLDNKAIDWKAESNVGKSGKRKEVLDALRKFKGDKGKVFDLLAPKAKSFYKGKSKHEAERTLVWLIGRVAYDFALKSGQHEPGSRAEYGTSEAPQDIRRREVREAQRKADAKAARAAQRGAPSRKPAGGRKSAPAKGKGKTTTARKR